MKKEHGYQPTPEEVGAAEGTMSDKEKEITEFREKWFKKGLRPEIIDRLRQITKIGENEVDGVTHRYFEANIEGRLLKVEMIGNGCLTCVENGEPDEFGRPMNFSGTLDGEKLPEAIAVALWREYNHARSHLKIEQLAIKRVVD